MKITQQIFTTHQFSIAERTTLCEAENIIRQIYNSYNDDDMLSSPNTGECVIVDELLRVVGILSFLTENRVVEVNPK